jgi:phage-related minor tail protein
VGNNIKGITIEIGGNTGPLSNALKEIDAPAKKVADELREVNRQLKYDPSNTVLLKQKQDLLAQSAEALQQKQAVLKEAVAQAQAQFEKGDLGADKVRAVQREYEKVTSQLKDTQKQLTEVEKTSGTVGERISATFKSAGASIKSAFTWDNVKTAIGTIGIAVSAFLKSSTDEATAVPKKNASVI